MIINTKLVEFLSTDNLPLPGILFEPKKKTTAAVIYLHGNGSSSIFKNLEQLQAAATALNKLSVAYFAFNNRGAGLLNKIRVKKHGRVKKIPTGAGYELIKDCIKDIDGAINFLQSLSYEKFFLIGFSTGANKICVYNYFKPKNKIAGYIIVAGGDDMGIYYKLLGKNKFTKLLIKAKQKIKQHKGLELAPELLPMPYSYQAFYDIANPDGDYNTFPYLEYFQNLKLSKKPLFRKFAKIKKPTLVIYGDKDEYIFADIGKIIAVLKSKATVPGLFTFNVIKNADHGFSGKEKELNNAINNWLKKL